MNSIVPNRREAGRRLAEKLSAYANNPEAIVLALPRGGVPVAYEIARALNLPLDVYLVRKLGIPGHPEVAMGAIAEDVPIYDYSGEVTIVDENVVQTCDIDREQIRAIAAREKAELRWRERCYRHFRPLLKIRDRIVILVDDGIATGLTMHAAITALYRHQPKSITIAVPVAAQSVIRQLKTQVDNIICLVAPTSFYSVSLWYEDFGQTTDREVCDLLERATQTSKISSC